MKDEKKTKGELIKELKVLRSQLADLKKREAEHEKTKGALASIADDWQVTFDIVDDMIAIIDSERNILRINRAMKEAFGDIDIKQKKCYELFHGNDEPFSHCPLTRSIESGEFEHLDFKEAHLDNRIYDIFACPIRYEEGVAKKVVHVVRDITDHKRAVEALHESEEKYRFLTENAMDVIWTIDSNLNFTYINRAVESMYGWTQEETIGSKLEDFLTPSSFQMALETMQEELYQGEQAGDYNRHRTLELESKRKDGSSFWTEIVVSFVLDENSKPIGYLGINRNIADRKQTEEALLSLRKAVESSKVGITITDLDRKIVYTNPSEARMHGWKVEELIGKEANVLGPEESRKLLSMEEIKQMKGFTRETINIRKDKSSFPVKLTSDIVKDETGEPLYIVSICEDITERKQAEEALRESRANLVEAQRIAHIGNWQRDLKTNKISWSDEMFRIFRIEKQEPNWKHLFDLVYPDDIYSLIKALTAMHQENKPLDIEFRIVYPDGSIAYVQNRGEVVCDETGAPIKTIGTLQDITVRRQVGEALRESEAKYRSFINDAHDAIFTLDVDGNYIEVNESFLRESGYSREEVIGANLTKVAHPEDCSLALSAFKEAKKGVTTQFEFRSQKKDGGSEWYSSKGRPIYDSKGSFVFLEVISRNITELKKTQQQLLDSQKMKAIGTLAGGIAHDFNNLMTSILGYASFLKDKSKAGDPFHKGLLSIEQSAIKAAELTSQLLAYSQKGKYNIISININSIVKNVNSIILESFDKSIKIDLNTAENLKNIEGDPSQITQVVMNLTINAQEAMPDGGTLIIQTYMESFSEDTNRERHIIKAGEYVCLKVIDTGIGMDNVVRDRIFEPYFTTKSEKANIGFGMSVVFGVVKGHGGYIDIESVTESNIIGEGNTGTEITIYFPVSKKKEETSI